MTTRITQATETLARCMRITEQGNYHVFFQYDAHVDMFTCYAVSSDNDYQSEDYEYVFWFTCEKDLTEINAALDGLEASI